MKAKIAVIIPLYNKEKYIIETLDSLNSQTFTKWMCYIIDDGSSDDSLKLVEDYCINKPNFKIYERRSTQNKGASSCRNIGLEISKEPYIQFLDADDVLSKDKFEKQIDIFGLNSKYSIVTCQWGRIEIKENILYKNLPSYKSFDNPKDFLNSLVKSKGYFPLHSYLIDRNLIKRVGYWNEKLTLNDDGEFMMRLVANTDAIGFAKDCFVLYRTGDTTNLSAKNDFNNVNAAIVSWKLIILRLRLRFNDDVNLFINYSKNALFRHILKITPKLIKKHPLFFQEEIIHHRKQNSLLTRVKKVVLLKSHIFLNKKIE